LIVTCISDTHELHRDLTLEDSDFLIFAGDITFFSQRPSVISDFNDWLGELPHRHKVIVPGNHDALLKSAKYQKQITNGHLLIDRGIELDGLKIWGSPVTPHADTAFGIPTAVARQKHWAKIPEGVDILVTHGPPHGILDHGPGETVHRGDAELFQAMSKRAPILHVFGHVHGGYGTHALLGTTFVNAALLGELGDLDKKPIRIRLERLPRN